MKKYLIMFVWLIWFPSIVSAAPFLICDPQTGVMEYQLTGPTWIPVSVPAQTDGSLSMDVAAAAIGVNSLTVKACIADPIWGQVCSDAVPFDFIRPAPPATIRNMRLIP